MAKCSLKQCHTDSMVISLFELSIFNRTQTIAGREKMNAETEEAYAEKKFVGTI